MRLACVFRPLHRPLVHDCWYAETKSVFQTHGEFFDKNFSLNGDRFLNPTLRMHTRSVLVEIQHDRRDIKAGGA